MSPFLALALVAPPEPSPYVYKSVVGEKAAYAVRFSIRNGSETGGLVHKLTTEVLSVGADGSAQVEFTASDMVASGMAKGQPFDLAPFKVNLSPFGKFEDFSSFADQIKILGVAFSLPEIALREREWAGFDDPLTHGMPGMEIEGTIKSRKGTQVVLLSRSKHPVQGQSFTRETTFDSKTGALIAVRLRGGIKGGPSVGLDIDRTEAKR